MKISFHTIQKNLNKSVGYGVAGSNVVKSLQELGHEVPFDDETAPVQISMTTPPLYKFHEGQYKIGYTPWESTELPAGWLEAMNACDEVWATSEWTAGVYANAGVTVPLRVYKHGLDPSWAPVKRKNDGVVKFFHHGEPALRKGGMLALDAFRAAFGDSKDVHLTFKVYHQHFLSGYNNGLLVNAQSVYDNITIIGDELFHREMVDLYHSQDVMVYPSYGEGFGFIPLQALGTGMPTISTHEWAPYADFLPPLTLNSRLDRSIWNLHPGDVYYPDYAQLIALYRWTYENIELAHEHYYRQAQAVHEAYNWRALTEEAFAHIVARFG
jgi:glycosyltransferase involved in cell wall biosynthesis